MTLSTIRDRFRRACSRLEGGHVYHDWFRTVPGHDGSAHIEQEGLLFSYVVSERGSEIERRQTDDMDQVLYWLMLDVTFDMAAKYERAHRRPSEDSRRLLFRAQEEILESLNVAWAKMLRQHHDDILRTHPFVNR